jgi:hypothetical protein
MVRRHFGAALTVTHSDGKRLQTASHINFDLIDITNAVTPRDGQFSVTEERVKWVVQDHDIRIASIVACRIKPATCALRVGDEWVSA